MNYTDLTLNPWRGDRGRKIFVSADGQELGNLQFSTDGRLTSRWYENSAHQDVMDAIYRTYAELERLGIIPAPAPATPTPDAA